MNRSRIAVITVLCRNCFCSLFLNNYLKSEGGYCFNALSTLIQTLLTPVGPTRRHENASFWSLNYLISKRKSQIPDKLLCMLQIEQKIARCRIWRKKRSYSHCRHWFHSLAHLCKYLSFGMVRANRRLHLPSVRKKLKYKFLGTWVFNLQ